jgi:hypothetical protein
MVQHSRGRPSRQGQVQIVKVLKPYFERGMSATFTANKTGYDIKTVCKYFDNWTEQILEPEKNDFLLRQKAERAKILLSLDNQLFELYQFFDEIKDEIIKIKRGGNAIPRFLFSLKLEIQKTISTLTEKKGSFAMQPIMDEALEMKVEEIVKKHGYAKPNS